MATCVVVPRCRRRRVVVFVSLCCRRRCCCVPVRRRRLVVVRCPLSGALVRGVPVLASVNVQVQGRPGHLPGLFNSELAAP